MSKDKISGIYCINNIANGKCYVGRSKNIYDRWWHHKNKLKKNIHDNPFLQSVYNKHGIDIFKLSVLQEVEPDYEKLKLMETYWIIYCNAYYEDGGYNMSYGGDGSMGRVQTEDTKEKIRIANSGENGYWYGKERSQDTIDKIKATKAENPYNPPTGPEHWNYGTHWNENQRENIPAKLKGHPNWSKSGWKMTPEQCEKVSQGKKGIVFTEEHKNNLSQSLKGRKSPMSKLSEDDVREIREQIGNEISGMQIARNFGVHKSVIYDIKDGKTYRWVT